MARDLLLSGRWVRLAFLAVLTVSVTAVLHAQNGERRLPRRGSAAIDAAIATANTGRDDNAIRLREGAELQGVSGTFKSTGDRITFYPAEQSDSFRRWRTRRWNAFGACCRICPTGSGSSAAS